MAGGVDPLIRVTVGRAGGDEFDALSRHEGGTIQLLPIAGELPAVDPGEQLALRRPVLNDATYEEPVVVLGRGSGGSVLVRLAGHRRRHQQRDHVRVDTSLQMMELEEVVDEIDDRGRIARQTWSDEDTGGRVEARRLSARVLDLSAGGARIEHPGDPLGVGTLWHVRTILSFDDGSELELTQVAEIRWALDPNRPRPATGEPRVAGDGSADTDPTPRPGPTTAATDAPATHTTDGGEDETIDPEPAVAGLRFLGVRPGLEESVTRWVFQQQAKELRIRRSGRSRP